MGSLFGTDGMRGVAYERPLDPETVFLVGRALARHLPADAPRVLIGRDTRASGPDIESWLLAGIRAGGGSAVATGVLTTPAVAFLTQHLGFEAGLMISASHNPYRDNGVKIFNAAGGKTGEAIESRIEAEVEQSATVPAAEIQAEPLEPDAGLGEMYLDHLVQTLGPNFAMPPLSLALDCAHGAGYLIGPRLLERLGAKFVVVANEPNGENINRECGSTHPETVARAVREGGCDFGAALDGDGDRVLLVDEDGTLVNGDAILRLCATWLKRNGKLTGSAVVATVMSNMALERALSKEGITLYRTQVGDKFVAQEMTQRNIIVGGEQSGHVIFSDHASTGDGLLTLLQVLRVLASENSTLKEIGNLPPFPQVLLNVPVRERPDVSEVPAIAAAIGKARETLEGRGRVLVRYSGTEPLLRIMMEGPEGSEIEKLAAEVGDAVRGSIGDLDC